MTRRSLFGIIPSLPLVGLAALLRSGSAPDADDAATIKLGRKEASVKLTVGKDSALWINSGEGWKRVATE